jgi:hypothetical protein
MINKTLQHENQLVINCPVFATKSRIAACFILRDLVWRGDGPTDKRIGCQAAMVCGKCPIDRLVKDMVKTGKDEYHSTEPKERSFDAELLHSVGKVLITDQMMQRFALSSVEQKLLLQHNDDAKNYVDQRVKKTRKISAGVELDAIEAPKVAPVASALVSAAQSGDMTAAINAEVAGA